MLWCCCLPRLLVIVKQIECCLEQPPQSPMVFRWADLFGKFQICILKSQNEFWVSLWIHKIHSDPSISLEFIVSCTQPVKISRQLVHFLLPVEYLLLPQHINSMILNENYTSLDPCCLPVWLPCLKLQNTLTGKCTWQSVPLWK